MEQGLHTPEVVAMAKVRVEHLVREVEVEVGEVRMGLHALEVVEV